MNIQSQKSSFLIFTDILSTVNHFKDVRQESVLYQMKTYWFANVHLVPGIFTRSATDSNEPTVKLKTQTVKGLLLENCITITLCW